MLEKSITLRAKQAVPRDLVLVKHTISCVMPLFKIGKYRKALSLLEGLDKEALKKDIQQADTVNCLKGVTFLKLERGRGMTLLDNILKKI